MFKKLFGNKTQPEVKPANTFSAELKDTIEASTLQIMTHDLYMHYWSEIIVEDTSNPEWQNLALFFWRFNEAFEKKSLPTHFKELEKKVFIVNELPESVSVSVGKVIPWFGMPGGWTKYFFSRNNQEVKITELVNDKCLTYVEIISLTDSNKSILTDQNNYFFIMNDETTRIDHGRFYFKEKETAFADVVEIGGIEVIKISN